MTERFLATLLDQASQPFVASGHFAYRFARGKLGGDGIFVALLRRGIFPAQGHFLDLGCGQGHLFAWLLAAHSLYARGQWPSGSSAGWPAPPHPLSLRGIELMPKEVRRAQQAFGADHPVVHMEQGDMCKADFGRPDVITLLDALHYFDYAQQVRVLQRVRAALPAGGLFVTRIGDASAGLPFHFSNWVDHVVSWVRGYRGTRLYCRSLAEWTRLLKELGFEVQSDAMNHGKPFANVMLVCRVV